MREDVFAEGMNELAEELLTETEEIRSGENSLRAEAGKPGNTYTEKNDIAKTDWTADRNSEEFHRESSPSASQSGKAATGPWKIIRNRNVIRGLSAAACLAIAFVGFNQAMNLKRGGMATASYKEAAYDADYDNYATTTGSASANGMYMKSEPAAEYEMAAEEYAVADYADTVEAPAEAANTTASLAGEEQLAEGSQNYAQKLIRTYYYDISTETFDESLEAIKANVEKFGGYIESSQINAGTRPNASMTLRIPTARVDEFLKSAGTIGEITYQSVDTEDVTLTYYDITARLESLHAQHDRLIELIGKAEDLSDIAALEAQLSNVEYEISSYDSTLRVYDNKVDYTTVNLSLYGRKPVEVLEEDGFLTRLQKGFFQNLEDAVDTLGDMVIGVVIFLPYLIAIVPAAVFVGLMWKLVVWIFRIVRKANLKKLFSRKKK